MSVYELSVFSVILHSGSNAAPHRAVGLGIDAVVTRASRGEVNVTSVFGVLGRQDMIEQSALVEIGILGGRRHSEQTLGQLQHIVGVT